jgi:hypothetical protein
MRFIFKVISRLFTLITVIFFLLYAYGAYLAKQAEDKDRALDLEIQSGNGFGGEAGMKIIDSEFSTSEFFWIDDDLLLFMIKRPTAENPRNRDNYIWDFTRDEVLPLELDGSASCIRDGYFYFSKIVGRNGLSGEREMIETFRSKLARKGDRWSISKSQNIREVWSDIPDRYEYAWRDGHECKIWYYLPHSARLPGEPPRHHFRYLSMWNWIFRFPANRKINPGTALSDFGLFEIGNSPYYGQNGNTIEFLTTVPVEHYDHLVFKYIPFADRYWVASRLSHYPATSKYLAVLNRTGHLSIFNWPDSWKKYRAIPLPTRKGVFWSSYDYRQADPGSNNVGGFLLTQDSSVTKVIHGSADSAAVSPDGCKVAFYNQPKFSGTNNSRLRIFDVCNSSIQGREMIDVQFRDRSG